MATKTARADAPARRIRAPDARRPRRAPALHAPHAGHRGARDEPLPPGQGARLLLRRLRPGGRVGRRRLRDGRRRTACASCTATSARTSCAASTPARILGQYMGREGGITGGRDGNVHFGDHRLGCVGMVSMLPDMMLVATGMAMAFKLRGEQRCAITWFGDGSTSRGDFHEAMNWAGVQQLPVIFVLENNQYAYSTPTDAAVRRRPRRARRGLRLPGRDGRRQRRRGDVRGHAPRRASARSPARARRCSRP